MLERTLPDGNKYYSPKTMFQENASIDKNIDEIYNPLNPHHYETFYKIKEGMTVVDAGAYSGLFTLKASKLVGSGGLVIALEPFPASFRVLEHNMKENKCKNVVVLNKGLWNCKCKKKLIIQGAYTTNTVLRSQPSVKSITAQLINLLNKLQMQFALRTNKLRFVEVELTTLDDVMKSFNLNRIDFLKLDIEGSEIEALKRYTKISNNNVLVAETHGNLGSVLYLINKLGYPLSNIHVVPINERASIIHAKF